MRQAQTIMGTGVTVDISEAKDGKPFIDVFKLLKEIDEHFSTYKEDSEVSRFARGEIAERELSAELKMVVKACLQAEKETDGLFSAWAGGKFEPSGYVKGWAIARASDFLTEGGYGSHCISIGGDIQARGSKPWNIGIQDPTDRMNVVSRIAVKDGAIATSGNYVRGAHIINPKTGQAADGLASVSVVGPDIIMADVLATAAFVAGSGAIKFIKKTAPGYEILVIHKDGSIKSSPGMSKHLI